MAQTKSLLVEIGVEELPSSFVDAALAAWPELVTGKLAASVDALRIVEKEAAGKQKAGRYVVGRKKEKGQPAEALLAALVPEIGAALPFRKSMRWGTGD